MPTRLRKTRKLRGGRHMGWGQVAQHRASGHKGGLGRIWSYETSLEYCYQRGSGSFWS